MSFLGGGTLSDEGEVMRRGFRIRGRVQGVGFRWWTAREAHRLQVAGTVRNLEDGAVAVMAVGRPEALDRFHHALSSGPPLARVDAIDETAYEGDPAPTDFSIER